MSGEIRVTPAGTEPMATGPNGNQEPERWYHASYIVPGCTGHLFIDQNVTPGECRMFQD